MIPLNSRQVLSARAFWYLLLRGLLGVVVLVLLARFWHLMASLPGAKCGGIACSKSNAGAAVWILYLFAGVLIVNSILKFTRFSFILTDRTVTIDSGVFFQSTRVIRFDKIQDVEAKRGLLLMLLGLKSVAIWTASLDQVRGNTRRPDGLIVLDTDTADWLANFLSDPDTHRNTPPEDADRADMQPTMRSRTGNFGALFGFASVVLLGVIAWGLWSKSGGTPPATVAAAAPSGTAATAAAAAPASTAAPTSSAAPTAAASPSPASSAAPQTYAANSAAEAADYTIACSVDSSGVAHGAPACGSMKWGQRCEREAEFRSAPTTEETRLVIANRGGEVLKFYWLDGSGHRILYAVLPPGRKIAQPSHIGAHWLVASHDDRCVAIVNADTARIGVF